MERVLVRPPDTSAALAWQEYCWRAELDVRLAVAEHEVFCTALRGAGVEVIVATSPVEGDPDGIYVYDRGRC
jgi:N-dimethylarginine dimethylaminohydrolase